MGKEMKSCVIISGAPEQDIDYYRSLISSRFVICADSGYQKCLALDINPQLIVGDFDSSETPSDAKCEVITLPVRKNDTDTFFAVKEAVKRGFDDILLLGAIGSRLDHTYSNILALSYCADRNVHAVMLNKSNRLRVLTEGCTFEKDGYAHFSLFALFGDCVGLTTRGTEYDLTDYTLSPSNPLAQSNSIKGDRAQINFKSGKILLIQSND